MYILDRYQKGKHFLGLVGCFSRTLQNAPHNLLIINIIHIIANTQINATCTLQIAFTLHFTLDARIQQAFKVSGSPRNNRSTEGR